MRKKSEQEENECVVTNGLATPQLSIPPVLPLASTSTPYPPQYTPSQGNGLQGLQPVRLFPTPVSALRDISIVFNEEYSIFLFLLKLYFSVNWG